MISTGFAARARAVLAWAKSAGLARKAQKPEWIRSPEKHSEQQRQWRARNVAAGLTAEARPRERRRHAELYGINKTDHARYVRLWRLKTKPTR